jgi:hypothetical protein
VRHTYRSQNGTRVVRLHTTAFWVSSCGARWYHCSGSPYKPAGGSCAVESTTSVRGSGRFWHLSRN